MIFLSPGNQKNEIEKNCKILKKTLKKFIIKYSYGEFKKENFKCILSFEEKNYEN